MESALLGFLQKSELWWGLTALCVVFFAVANFPRFSAESLPWLLIAAGCAAMAIFPAGTIGDWMKTVIVYGWDDRTMRWHLIGALICSIPVTMLSLGMPGFLPIAFTGIVTHPTDAFRFLTELNRSQLGDNAWPFLLLSAFMAPWAFPAAWGLIANTAIADFAVLIKGATYTATVALWWVTQSVAFSYLFYKKSLFW